MNVNLISIKLPEHEGEKKRMPRDGKKKKWTNKYQIAKWWI